MPKFLDPFAVPLVFATVFTLGGYAIMRMKKHAETVGAWLGIAFAFCTVVIGVMLLDRFSESRTYTPTNQSRSAQANRPTLASAPTNERSVSPSVPPLIPADLNSGNGRDGGRTGPRGAEAEATGSASPSRPTIP